MDVIVQEGLVVKTVLLEAETCPPFVWISTPVALVYAYSKSLYKPTLHSNILGGVDSDAKVPVSFI